MDRPVGTPTQWLWLFRDHCFKSAESAGVDYRTVTAVMDKVGAAPDQFPFGPGVVIGSNHERERVPVGTVVYTGNPNSGRRFGVFRFTASGWENLFGNYYLDGDASIVSVPEVSDPPEWWTDSPNGDSKTLNNVKAKAWRTVFSVKLDHGWCSSFEEYMNQIGLNGSVLRHATHAGISTGERIDPRQVALLPAGSVLRWVSNREPETRWAWYIRDDEMTNEARTKYLFGRWDNRPEGKAIRNSADVMEVVHIHSDEQPLVFVPEPGWQAILNYIPVGTILSRSDLPSDRFVLCEDRRIAPGERPLSTGVWDLLSYADPDIYFRIVRFPS